MQRVRENLPAPSPEELRLLCSTSADPEVVRHEAIRIAQAWGLSLPLSIDYGLPELADLDVAVALLVVATAFTHEDPAADRDIQDWAPLAKAHSVRVGLKRDGRFRRYLSLSRDPAFLARLSERHGLESTPHGNQLMDDAGELVQDFPALARVVRLTRELRPTSVTLHLLAVNLADLLPGSDRLSLMQTCFEQASASAQWRDARHRLCLDIALECVKAGDYASAAACIDAYGEGLSCGLPLTEDAFDSLAFLFSTELFSEPSGKRLEPSCVAHFRSVLLQAGTILPSRIKGFVDPPSAWQESLGRDSLRQWDRLGKSLCPAGFPEICLVAFRALGDREAACQVASALCAFYLAIDHPELADQIGQANDGALGVDPKGGDVRRQELEFRARLGRLTFRQRVARLFGS